MASVPLRMLLGICIALSVTMVYGKAHHPHTTDDDDSTSGCASLKCSDNEKCVEKKVFCFRAPCPKQVSCEPDSDSSVKNPCSRTRCPVNKRCVVEDSGCSSPPCARCKRRHSFHKND